MLNMFIKLGKQQKQTCRKRSNKKKKVCCESIKKRSEMIAQAKMCKQYTKAMFLQELKESLWIKKKTYEKRSQAARKTLHN